MEINPQILFGGIAVTSMVTGLFIKVIDRGASKRKAVYDKIENSRKETEKRYVPREVCHTHVDSLKEDIKEIKTDVKTLLKLNGK